MNRRQFLKTIGKFFIGAVVIYIAKIVGVFHRGTSNTSAKTAKFYRQADDLAG